MNVYSAPAIFSGRRGSVLAAVLVLHLLLGYGLTQGLVGKFRHESTPPLQNLDPIPNPKEPPKLSATSLHFDDPTLYVPPVQDPNIPRDDPATVTAQDLLPPLPQPADSQPGAPLQRAATPVAIDPKHPLKIGAEYYPDGAVRANEQGKCVVQITVGVDGRVNQASIRSSTGYRRLDDACLNAVRGARMLPATQDGKRVEKTATMPIVWTLNAR
jgi:periplasmic protein TonB